MHHLTMAANLPLLQRQGSKKNVPLLHIARQATCVNISAEDIPALLAFARDKAIDLTLVGPEAPLTAGIVDEFQAAGLKIFGPSRAAAEIEGSKFFAKEIMAKYGIPTAGYAVFTSTDEAIAHIQKIGVPCVRKADGLAAGKGVIIANDLDRTAVSGQIDHG